MRLMPLRYLSVAILFAMFTAPLVEGADRKRLFTGAGIFGRLGFLMVAFASPPDLACCAYSAAAER